MMHTRPYQPGDFDAVLALINAAADADRTKRMTESGLRSAFIAAPAFDETAVALADDNNSKPVGFAWWEVLSEGSRIDLQGWVHPDYRRQGAGTALLNAVEQYVRSRGYPSTTLAGRTYEDMPDAQALFCAQGYEVVRHFYMMSTPLTGRTFAPDIPAGITIRAFEPAALEKLVAADNDIFSDHWGSLPKSVESWRHHMMELRPHNPALWMIAWDGDQIVGECLNHVSLEGGPTDGWVCVVGVHSDWRGRGLGQAVLAQGLKTLQGAGFTTASLHVDAANTAAVKLYQRLGMAVVRTRLHYAKLVTGD